jgi:hypothetical protein
MARLSNLEVYGRLIALSRELEEMADTVWSPAGATALRTCARLVRATASGFFVTLGDPPAEDRPPGPPPV